MSSYDSDYQNDLAFGDWSGDGPDISESTRNDIEKIRSNDRSFRSLKLDFEKNHFSSWTWKMLGRYIARNDYLKELILSEMYLEESDISCLFSEMTIGKSMDWISLSSGVFSVAACNNMVPFLKNSSNLTHIDIESSETFDTRCFDVTIRALSGGPLQSLCLDGCCVDSIAALEHCSFTRLHNLHLGNNTIVSKMSGLEKLMCLETLRLNDNPIDNVGCIEIAKLLKKISSLIEFSLTGTNIDNVGGEILACSLKNNKTLYSFELDEEKMTEEGGVPFLKLKCDVSSIEGTYNSNHVCDADPLDWNSKSAIKRYIRMAQEKDSEFSGDLHRIGRSKVIEFQLNSKRREELCRLQGVAYNYNSIFEEIDPLVLADVLSMVGSHHGHTELYRMIVAAVPDLGSLVFREAVVKQMIAKKMAQIESLTTDIRHLHEELEWIESGRVKDQRKKQRISASF